MLVSVLQINIYDSVTTSSKCYWHVYFLNLSFDVFFLSFFVRFCDILYLLLKRC